MRVLESPRTDACSLRPACSWTTASRAPRGYFLLVSRKQPRARRDGTPPGWRGVPCLHGRQGDIPGRPRRAPTHDDALLLGCFYAWMGVRARMNMNQMKHISCPHVHTTIAPHWTHTFLGCSPNFATTLQSDHINPTSPCPQRRTTKARPLSIVDSSSFIQNSSISSLGVRLRTPREHHEARRGP
jgi:hypothetical protein